MYVYIEIYLYPEEAMVFTSILQGLKHLEMALRGLQEGKVNDWQFLISLLKDTRPIKEWKDIFLWDFSDATLTKMSHSFHSANVL